MLFRFFFLHYSARNFAANTLSTILGFTCAPRRWMAASASRRARWLCRRPAAATARKSVSRAAAPALSFS